ncbi:MAG: efflux transporter outer membrane subunit [Gammaproteobacteria bacterium]
MSRAGAVVLLGLSLGACMVGPDFEPPEMDPGEQFAGLASPGVDRGAVEQAWWRRFGDPRLDALIQEAFVANHDLRIARANVARARALLSEGELDLWPTVTAEGGVTRQRQSAQQFGSAFPVEPRIEEYYDAGLDAFWELDFFGRVRRANQALEADLAATVLDERFVLVTVASEVGLTYIDLRGAQYRLDVARRNADNQRRTYGLTLALLEGGRGTELDLARAQSQLATTLASIPPLEAEVARAMHRLAVLVGRRPPSFYSELASPPEDPLPAIPGLVDIGDPEALLRRRPDIAAAEARLEGATARIGVAVADLFPRVSIVGSGGWTATSLDDLGDERAERFSIGPTLTWAAFDLGSVRARIRAAEAEADVALATYEQVVLRALEETETALARYGRSRAAEQRLIVAAEASDRAAELARIRYRNGVDSFLTVLDAERRQLEAQDQLARAETDTARALVTVYKALGGGWGSDEAVEGAEAETP